LEDKRINADEIIEYFNILKDDFDSMGVGKYNVQSLVYYTKKNEEEVKFESF